MDQAEHLQTFAIAATSVVVVFGMVITWFLTKLVDEIRASTVAHTKLGVEMAGALQTMQTVVNTLKVHDEEIAVLKTKLGLIGKSRDNCGLNA